MIQFLEGRKGKFLYLASFDNPKMRIYYLLWKVKTVEEGMAKIEQEVARLTEIGAAKKVRFYLLFLRPF